jgi:molybdate transport system substrate-binding protein
MHRVAAAALTLLVWLNAVPTTAGRDSPPASILVAAAISLTDVLTAAANEFPSGPDGVTVRFNFSASNVLARQIVSGAPADLFISADEAQMDVVEKAALIASGTRVNLLRNQLAVVVPDDRRRTFTSIRDVLGSPFKRIAIGDPAAVPAGVYAKQYLESEGLWTTLQPRIVPTASVRAALAAVESGAADAAIVYRTDARLARHATTAWLVPADRGPRIVYPAARLKNASSPTDADRFLAFLQSEAGTRIFERFGFPRAVQGR